MNFSSKDKKILIISDIHQEVNKFSNIISKEAADINIVLGDWFDSYFFNSESAAKDTLHFLYDFLRKPNNFTLWGNHDLSYFFINKYTYCSGFSMKTQTLINNFANKQFFYDKFLWYCYVDDYFCSHAGLADIYFPVIKNKDKVEISSYLNDQIQAAKVALFTGGNHWIYSAGLGRGGNARKGGLTWLDFKKEFVPIQGFNQIFGHTYNRSNKIEKNGLNYCIDTNLNEWLTVEDRDIKIRRMNDIDI